MADPKESEVSIFRRFEELLSYRGIKRVGRSTDQAQEERRVSSRELRRSYNLFPTSDDEPSQLSSGSESQNLGVFEVDNFDIDMNDDRVIDYFGLSRIEDNLDADLFYNERRGNLSVDDSESVENESVESMDSEGIDDKDIQYVAVNKYGDRRFSNNCKEIEVLSRPNLVEGHGSGNEKFPVTSHEAYLKWEVHDDITMQEIADKGMNRSNSDGCHDGANGAPNGGIYDPFKPDFSTIENSDPSRLVALPPGEKFRDHIKLQPLGIKKLNNLENVRKYKNNLTAVFTDGKGIDYSVASSNSELVIYTFDPISQLPTGRPVFRFDTRPAFTTTTDRLISSWPYFPHTINFMKVCTWLDKQVLSACLDDGTLMIWNIDTIMHQIDRFSSNCRSKLSDVNEDDYNDSNRFYGFKVAPDFKLKLEASLWGLDMLSYVDDESNSHHVVAASDNSQGVTLFYYHSYDRRFYHIKSHQVLHNIPEVAFISHHTNKNKHKIEVSCSSISGELIIFGFEFMINSGPLDQDEYDFFRNESMYYVDPTMAHIENRRTLTLEEDAFETEMRFKRFHRIIFKSPVVKCRALLNEDCWSCKPIKSGFFKPVQSIRAMTGDPWIDEAQEERHIMNETTILDMQYDPVKVSHLGLSTCWQFFECPVLSFSNPSMEDNNAIYESSKLTSIDDDYRRIHKGLKQTNRHLKQLAASKEKSLNGYYYTPLEETSTTFLAVSTSKKLALFRSDTLFCNTATKKVFDLSIPFNDESKFSNRISLTLVVPELLCLIAATQQGLVTILRFCSYRGLHGMRQEHIFPNALSLALGYHGYRTICGISVRNVCMKGFARFFLYITYTDAIVIGYELSV